ncbi:MAG: CoA-binding protein [Betaproteobacteria bacterium]
MPGSSSRPQRGTRVPSDHDAFAPLFMPRVVAVVGASATGINLGNEFIRHTQALKFTGRIIPVHPTAATIEGLPAVKSLSDIDGPVDFAYISVKADDAPSMMASGAGKVRYAQVVSSGFRESGTGQALEQRLVAAARSAGTRLLGPNSLGTYSPRGRISFIGQASDECGNVAVIAQSGGLGADVILRGQNRGLRYRAVVTLGNSADVGPVEMIEHFLGDADTKVIGLYAEDIGDGRAFFRVLRGNGGRKPVVVLLGGQTDQGSKAAASHTGSLVTGTQIWKGIVRQTGIVLVQTLDEFLDVLLAFQTLTPHRGTPTRRCVLFGNGGGTSVLAADAFDRHGLALLPIGKRALDRFAALKLFPGTSVENPIDTPITTLRQKNGDIAHDILRILLEEGDADAVVMHLNLTMFVGSADQTVDFLRNVMTSVFRAHEHPSPHTHLLLVLRTDGSEAVDKRRREFRAEAVQRGVPVYDELVNAAVALTGLAGFERHG